MKTEQRNNVQEAELLPLTQRWLAGLEERALRRTRQFRRRVTLCVVVIVLCGAAAGGAFLADARAKHHDHAALEAIADIRANMANRKYQEALDAANAAVKLFADTQYDGELTDLLAAVKEMKSAEDKERDYAGCVSAAQDKVRTRDYEGAVVLYRKALVIHSTPAIEGELKKLIIDRAEWYRKAAKAEKGFVLTDRIQAAKWYRMAAERGDVDAMCDLGDCLVEGSGIAKDSTEAIKWYRNAAEACNAEGMFRLGVCLQFGDGIAKDEAEAVQWFRKAVEAGHVEAMLGLAGCLIRGEGTPKDSKEAINWYREAATRGNRWAMFNLGYCLKKGIGIQADTIEGDKWLSKFSEGAGANELSGAGESLLFGYVIPKDEKEAAIWYRKAIEAGDMGAMTSLGLCIMRLGGSKNEEEAVKWYQKAAGAGDHLAMLLLGDCFRKGTGVLRDRAKAFHWYIEAEVGDDKKVGELAHDALKELRQDDEP